MIYIGKFLKIILLIEFFLTKEKLEPLVAFYFLMKYTTHL